MNRQEGLTRRNRPQTNTSHQDSPDYDEKPKDDGGEYEDPSKETRLTLMEEVLLLGLKDREVYSTSVKITCSK